MATRALDWEDGFGYGVFRFASCGKELSGFFAIHHDGA